MLSQRNLKFMFCMVLVGHDSKVLAREHDMLNSSISKYSFLPPAGIVTRVTSR